MLGNTSSRSSNQGMWRREQMQSTSHPGANGLFSGLSAFVGFFALSFAGGLLVNHSMTSENNNHPTLKLWGLVKESESNPGGQVKVGEARSTVKAFVQETSTIPARAVEGLRPYSSQAEPKEPPESGIAVQVGAFEDRMAAELLRQDLSTLTHRTVRLSSVQLGSKTFYRLRIRVGSEAEANSLAGFLNRERRLESWIVR